MSKQPLVHEYLEWAKQKLGEIDATLASLDASVETLKGDARKQADSAIARVRTARDAFKANVDAVRSDAASVKPIADDALVAIMAKWTEVELAFQEFLTAAAGQANVVKKALADRAEAQRQSWQSSLQATRATALAAIDRASAEADSAVRRLAAETEKAEAKLGRVSAVGDESRKAIKSGLDEAISIYDRTWKRISEALSKI
jgi:acyl-CoA hydrolase